MCGGTAGEIVKSVNEQGRRPVSWKNLDKYKKEKLDPMTESMQHNAGQVTGDMYDSFEMGMEGIGDFVERNTRSLMPQDEGGDQTSDTVSANYTKSSSEKSSQTKSTAKKKGGEGTGGSKSQFYAKK